MEESKFEIKLDPVKLYPGLQEKMDEFEKLVQETFSSKRLAEAVEKDWECVSVSAVSLGTLKGDCLGSICARSAPRTSMGMTRRR